MRTCSAAHQIALTPEVKEWPGGLHVERQGSLPQACKRGGACYLGCGARACSLECWERDTWFPCKGCQYALRCASMAGEAGACSAVSRRGRPGVHDAICESLLSDSLLKSQLDHAHVQLVSWAVHAIHAILTPGSHVLLLLGGAPSVGAP